MDPSIILAMMETVVSQTDGATAEAAIDGASLIKAGALIGAGICMGFGAIGPGIGEGFAAGKADFKQTRQTAMEQLGIAG